MTREDQEAQRARGIRTVLIITLAANVAVAAAKVMVGTALGSLSIRADGFHSSMDGLNNIVLLVGTWLAAAPPDREHPYGHRKFEVLAASFIGLSLLAAAFNVFMGVVDRLRGLDVEPAIEPSAFAVLGVTLAVNVVVAVYEARAGKRLMSPALISDAVHTRGDILVTVGVAASTLLVWRGLVWLDAVAGAAIAGYIVLLASRVLRENAGYLLDASVLDPTRVLALADGVEGVGAARDARSRGTPGGIFIDLTVEVDGALPVAAAHALAHRVEDAVRNGIPGVMGVQVHVEPRAAS
ncbi:MAG: hypothetical protein A2138_08865 [Deltaproteobacteria bacterium RBG_16_71_12]|nr:MAG: hypothetical protein A2138_08865 [Deltaproteobacteria bacterium RBG_16_71_12]